MIENFNYKTSASQPIDFWKIILKIFVWAFILFFIVTTLWGCGEQIFNNSTTPYSHSGGGFEIIDNPKYGFNNHLISNNGEVNFNAFGLDSQGFHKAMSLGPFYGLFVWPLSFLASQLLLSLGQYKGHSVYGNGFAIIFTIFIIVLLIRLTITLISFKQFRQQIVMQQIQPEIAKIQAKYKNLPKNLTTKQQMQRETMQLYKKHNVNPIQAFAIMFVTLPFFYAMYRVFSSLRIFKDNWIINNHYKLVTSTWNAIHIDHHWIYLIFVLILIPIQALSIKLPTILGKRSSNKTIKQKTPQTQTSKSPLNMSQNGLIMNVMVVFLAIFDFTMPLSIVFYLTFSSFYTVVQTYCIYKFNLKQAKTKMGEHGNYLLTRSKEKKKIRAQKRLDYLKKQKLLN